MSTDQANDPLSHLRQRAEAAAADQAQKGEDASPEALQRLVHELRVHQIELELQNEELRRTQLELELAKTNYAALYDAAPVGYLTLDEAGLIVEANLTAAALLEVNRNRLVGARLARFVTAEDQDAYHFYLRRLFKTVTLQRSDLRLVRKDGSHFYARLEGQVSQADPEISPTARASLLWGRIIISDITPEWQAAAATRYQATLVDNVSDAIIATDSLLNITVWNSAAEKIYGWSAAEVRGKAIFEVIPAEFPQTTPEAVVQHLHKQGNWHGEMVQRRKDGMPVYALASTSQIRNEAGELIGAVTINHDLTERKRAEETLRESETRLNLALTASQMGVWEWDIPTDAVFWSPQCLKIVGVAHLEGGLETFVQALHPEDAAGVMAAAHQALAERTVFTAEFRFIRPDGEVRWLSNLGQGVYDENGTPLRLIGTVQDITGRKRAEDELSRYAARNEALLEIAGALAETGLDVRVTLDTIARQAALAIGDACIITRLSGDEQWFEAVAFYHPDPAVETMARSLLTAAPVPATPGWLGSLLRNKQPLLVPMLSPEQVRQTLNPRYWPYLEQVGMHSLLVVPWQIQGRVIGMVGLSRDRPGQPYTTDDQIFLQELADRAALTLQNAQLFEQLQALSLRLLEVQERERRYLARELHDEVGQLLTGLKLKLELSARAPAAASKIALAETQMLVNDLMGRVRNLSLDLRPSMLDDLGLLPALLWHFERYTAQTGVQVMFRHSGLDQRFPPSLETAVYRLVQEALTNVARHAGVNQAQVQVWTDPDLLHLQVKDEGRGFVAEVVLAASSSVGLRGMQERAALLDGWLMVESAPGSGACVTVELPLVKEPQ